MGHFVQNGIGAGGNVEAPRLDATVPVAPYKGHVGYAVFAGRAGADKEFIFAVIRARQRLRILPNAAGVRSAAGQQFAFFVADGNRRVGYGLAGIQRSDPHQRIGAATLEVHAQVGYQHAGAHIHGALAAVAGIQQALPQQGRSRFNDVKARLQRYAQHFKLAGVFGAGRGQFQFGGLRVFQQRDHACFHIIIGNAPAGVFRVFLLVLLVIRRQGGGQVAHAFGLGFLALDHVPVEQLHALVPADDFRIRFGREVAHNAARCVAFDGEGGRFYLAHRNGQKRGRLFALGKKLNHAKRRCRKLQQSRHGACAHPQRKAAGVAQGAACIIHQACGQYHLVFGMFAQVAGKAHHFNSGAFGFFGRELRLNGFAGRLQLDLLGPLHGNGGCEINRHGPNRHAGRFGIGALAAEIGFQR